MARFINLLPSKYLTAVVAIILFAPTVGCEFKCGTGGHEKRLEKSIAKQLAKQLNKKVDKVNCPDDIEAKEGDVSKCLAIFAGGETLPIEVLWTDDVGGFSWNAKPGVDALMKRLSARLSEALARKYKTEFSGATCPDKVAMKKGVEFECIATIASGSQLPVQVIWTDDEGSYEYADKGIVQLDKLEGLLGEQLKERNRPGTVDCHGKIRAAEPQSTFMCDIAFADGKSGQIKVLIKDWTGNVHWDYL